MSDDKNYHMTPEQFRQHGHRLVDWIANYYENVESYPVLSQIELGEIRVALLSELFLNGENFDDMLADVDRILLPGITHWQSPNFFAYFPANASGPSILGELLSAGLGVQGMLWMTSPACTELETHVMDWLVDMLGLPQHFKSTSMGGGVIQDTASSGALCALLAARERLTQYAGNEQGLSGNLVAYSSTQAHSSIEKAVKIAGLGRQNLHLIDIDENFAMRPELLAQRIQQDRQAGLVPCFVCATIGTTSSNALDPIAAIGRICREEGLWLHVDGAMSGTAALCPEFRYIQEGIELADSYCFNPHKWMFTNFDCDCLYVANRAALINTLSILPEYLRNKATESGAVIDYRDCTFPEALCSEAVVVIRHYGVEGLQHHVRQHIALAQDFANWVQASEDYELAAPAPLNLVCFRHKAGEEFNRLLMEELNQSGDLFLTHTNLNGQFTLRLCVGQTHTTARHVFSAWERIQRLPLDRSQHGRP
jgi:aromatic-L-amino-acid decarboxylase